MKDWECLLNDSFLRILYNLIISLDILTGIGAVFMLAVASRRV